MFQTTNKFLIFFSVWSSLWSCAIAGFCPGINTSSCFDESEFSKENQDLTVTLNTKIRLLGGYIYTELMVITTVLAVMPENLSKQSPRTDTHATKNIKNKVDWSGLVCIIFANICHYFIFCCWSTHESLPINSSQMAFDGPLTQSCPASGGCMHVATLNAFPAREAIVIPSQMGITCYLYMYVAICTYYVYMYVQYYGTTGGIITMILNDQI